MDDSASKIELVIDELGRRGRTAILVSFKMPKTGRINANALSRADIQSMRTDDLADEKVFHQVLNALGEIGRAGLIGAPRVQGGEVSPYELKGDNLGMKLSEFKQKHPRVVNSPTTEAWHGKAGICHCMIGSPLAENGRTVGGVVTRMLLYEFVDEQLWRISATFSNDDYLSVEESVHQKYGSPMHNKKGSRTSVWANGVSSIHLFRGRGKEDSGLVFVHDELIHLVNERKAYRNPDL